MAAADEISPETGGHREETASAAIPSAELKPIPPTGLDGPERSERTERPDEPKKLESPKHPHETAQDAAALGAVPPQQTPHSDDELPAKRLEKRLKERRPSAAKKQPRAASSGVVTPAAGQSGTSTNAATSGTATPATADVDDFGLPIRRSESIPYVAEEPEQEEQEEKPRPRKWSLSRRSASRPEQSRSRANSQASISSRRLSLRGGADNSDTTAPPANLEIDASSANRDANTIEEELRTPRPPPPKASTAAVSGGSVSGGSAAAAKTDAQASTDERKDKHYSKDFAKEHARTTSAASDAAASVTLSEYSHQKLATEKTATKDVKPDEDEGWQEMPAFAPFDMYDDDNRLIAREHVETEEESYGYAGLGGAGKGYTRVLIDDDAESATSMDDNTQYLFKTAAGTSVMEDEEQQRDAVSQMQATKDLLTEGQRIAYVGITRLHMSNMTKACEVLMALKKRRKELQIATESMRMWSQKMMIRLYAHMDITAAEQVMIEQLSEHGVEPKDLTPALMANSRVKNPMAEKSAKPAASASSSKLFHSPQSSLSFLSSEPSTPRYADEEAAAPPPPYEERRGEELPDVRMPSQLPTTNNIDIDLRWTVLCDLFLVLIADSVYDARSRTLLELVGQSLDIPWIDICKFEKKVTDALEMQQNADMENWDEKDHMEARRKMALKRRYVMMGLATVGGGLVIGLSAGLLAPVIGAGLAAGFTTIGVTGTSGFLAGAGGAAVITSSAAASGSVIGVRAADRRTGAVRTFEYRPLHNNKKVNLIVTVSGWMTGKVDDVRLPYSTIDPVMGDIYSVLWEPEMLTSMGDTINILATEALTQGLQQVLGSTILVSLMAALQLPVVLTKLSYLIDNPWAVSLDRATMAGLILADSLIDRNLGSRPITLVGYSLGSRVIFSCLQELARKGGYGIVQNVYIFGSPIVVKKDEFLQARSVVAGRFVSGYNRNDWILGYLFRLTNGGIRRVAGLGPVDEVPGIENMDVTEFVVGHMDYRTAMPRLLRECGWLVESDEFTEIEDPDPENHAQRQRELIDEIEEARKELERESKNKKSGGAFSFFSRKKKGEKQEWEIYEDSKRAKGGSSKTEDTEGNNHGVLFDVDAIRAELKKENDGKEEDVQLEQLQVRELQSTLPPMKLEVSSTVGSEMPLPPPSTRSPYASPHRSARHSMIERSVSESMVPYRRPHEHRSSAYEGSLGGRTASSAYEPPYEAAYEGGGLPGERTPTWTPTPRGPSPVSYMEDSEGVSMTFDSSFDAGPTRGHSVSPVLRAAPGPASSGAGLGPGALAGVGRSPTVPAITLSDPWADDEDEDFGKEKEISMTFA